MNMKTTLLIPVHSFMDVITNSSSETFVAANDKTVVAAKAIIDLFLEQSGMSEKSDDVFTVEAVYVSRWADDIPLEDRPEVDEGAEDAISVLRVKVKPSYSGRFEKLATVMNALNDSFGTQEVMC